MQGTPVSVDKPAPARSSGLDVFANALYKGAAALPDMVLNAPQNVANLGRAAVGTVTNLAGRPDLSPDIVPTMDLARRSAEALRLIRPEIVPQGGAQKAIDLVTQGAIGGALTGGGGAARTAVSAGMGALSAGAAGATEAVTGRPALGAIAGVAVPAGVGRIMSSVPNLRPDVQALNEAGVQMTPGQIKGGTIQRMEDSATHMFGLGDLIKGAQRRGHESLGTVAMNRTLEPIGEKLPKDVKGNAAVAHVQDTLGQKYDALYGKMHGSLDGPTQASGQPGTAIVAPGGQTTAKPTLRQELTGIQQMGQNLPPQQRAQLDSIIQREILDRFTPTGLSSGETVQNIKSKLGGLASDLARSKNYDERTLGSAVKEMQSAVRRMTDEVNPQYAGEQAKLDQAYAQFKVIQRAASSVAAKDGVFTPAMLHSAVKAQDRSMDKGRFARGDALMQDLSQSAKNVLSPTVPDSGTATRALLGSGILGGAGYVMNHPGLAALAVGGTAASTLPYYPSMSPIVQRIMTRQPLYADIPGAAAPAATSSVLNEILRQRQENRP
jgi:hypothetical protein